MRTISALLLVAFTALPAHAHFNMLMPQTTSAKKGEEVVFTYQWGHPYEHELFDAPAPDSVQVLGPDGKTTADLTKALEKITLPVGEGKKVAAYQFHFTPEQRGDYVFLLRTPPIWMESDGEFLQDNVKVVLHVQAQKGWDGAFRTEFELSPLTRPYGLEPGMAFQAALGAGIPVKPVAGALVEIEHYHAAPPKEIPSDEYATRAAKTGPAGIITATLTDPGWWCLAAAAGAGGMRDHDGKSYPVKRRSIFWVHVDEKIADK
jgi:cobalt/nickel transport protein